MPNIQCVILKSLESYKYQDRILPTPISYNEINPNTASNVPVPPFRLDYAPLHYKQDWPYASLTLLYTELTNSIVAQPKETTEKTQSVQHRIPAYLDKQHGNQNISMQYITTARETEARESVVRKLNL